jgi:CheY-like chemotaxis protein
MTPPLTRVLLVDDEQDIRTVAQLSLSAVGGMTVECCGSGAEALVRIPQFKPDLVLLDVMMPGMDGPAILSRLRSDSATAHIPVVFVTARVQPQEVLTYRAIGALDVVAKPFDPMTLPQLLRDIWERHRG